MSLVLGMACTDGLLLAADGLAMCQRASVFMGKEHVDKIERLGSRCVWATSGTYAWGVDDGSMVSLADHSDRAAHDAAELGAAAVAATLTRRWAQVMPGGTQSVILLVLSNAGGRLSGAFARVQQDPQSGRPIAIRPEWNNMDSPGGYYCFGVGMEDANRMIVSHPNRSRFQMSAALQVFAQSVDVCVRKGINVGWPIRAAFVTTEAIRVVGMER